MTHAQAACTAKPTLFSSVPLPQQRGDDARIAATMEYSDHNEWVFIRRVGNEKTPNRTAVAKSGLHERAPFEEKSPALASSQRISSSTPSADSILSTAMNSQISSRSASASGWRIKPLMSGGVLHFCYGCG